MSDSKKYLNIRLPGSSVNNLHQPLFLTAKVNAEIGEIKYTINSNLPSGWLLCNGAALEKTDFPELFEVIGHKYDPSNITTPVDQRTQFYLPNCNDRYIQGAGSHAVGTLLNAGLPNITGHFPDGSDSDGYTPGGAFYKESWTMSAAWDGTCHPRVIGMNAARCSGVYGASSTVQPPAIVANIIIRYI